MTDDSFTPSPHEVALLREGISPITTLAESLDITNKKQVAFIRAITEAGINIEYGTSRPEEEALVQESEGQYHITSSPINSEHKFTAQLSECYAIVSTGINKETGEQQSCVTHVNPHFIQAGGDVLQTHLTNLCAHLVETSEQQTVDIQIMSGKVDPNSPTSKAEYATHIQTLGEIMQKTTGFYPKVFPPKFIPESSEPVMAIDAVYVDTEHRVVRLIRATDGTELPPQTTGVFNAHEVQKVVESWSQ